MRGLAVAVACVVVVAAGCATEVSGSAVSIPTAEADPNSPEVKWMNRWCGAGKLLTTAGETSPVPTTTSDAAVLKREFLEMTGRLAGVLDAVITDLRALRPAPAPGLDTPISKIIEGLVEARGELGTAHSEVEAADPMTAEAYSSGVKRFGRSMHGLASAQNAMLGIELPDELKDAAQSASNCD
ncbi:hypothetical protein [Actinokineospora sp. HUAS TT18]|uniref:hypothetical protein n=1 Tax=Actinokineospora sp. HUAS TT18 TaxID=3447451 RepID=UPI003F523E06